MKNRKGFTIVELVIVIAVIAILAAVLIPTFSGIISKANQSAAQQTAMQAVKAGLLCISTAQLPNNTFILIDTDKAVATNPDYGYVYDGNALGESPEAIYDDNKAFKTSIYLTATDKEQNTILINSDENNYSLIEAMLKAAYKAASATITGNTATIVIGEVDTEGGESDDITLTVGTTGDMPKNAIVFVKLG